MRKPKFDAYICIGDIIEWKKEGFTLRARIVYDGDTRPSDCDAYTPRQITRWKNDEWFFCGVIVSAVYEGVTLTEESLWGIDCNLSKASNRYITQAALELGDTAIATAREKIASLLQKFLNQSEV